MMRTERQLLEKNYRIRKRRLRAAFEEGAHRVDRQLQYDRATCAICQLREHGGGLLTYELRDGQELLVGHRCSEYLEYLLSHPDYAHEYGN